MSGWDVQDVAYSERKLASSTSDSARVHTQTKFYQFLHQYQVRDIYHVVHITAAEVGWDVLVLWCTIYSYKP